MYVRFKNIDELFKSLSVVVPVAGGNLYLKYRYTQLRTRTRVKRTHDEHCEQCIVIRHNDCTSWCTSLWHRCAITYVSMTAERRLWLQRVRLFHHEYADRAVNTLPLESDTILNFKPRFKTSFKSSRRPRFFQLFSFSYIFL